MKPDTGKIPAPCGGWPSVITPEMITAGSIGRDHPCEVDGNIYWQEIRPDELGRTTVVVRFPNGAQYDLLPYPMSTQSKVHEYGGHSWLVADGSLFFVDKMDQCIYQTEITGCADSATFNPRRLTPLSGGLRFADFCLDSNRNNLVAVCEEHAQEHAEVRNYLVAIPLDGSGCDKNALDVLVDNADFFAYPRLSTDDDQLCWICWNQPQMPWDGTELWCAPLDENGALGQHRKIAGSATESIFQPEWSPQGVLHYVSDASGWRNLYRHYNGINEPLHPIEAEFATPLWSLGMRTYGFLAEHSIACLFTRAGRWSLGILDSTNSSLATVDNECTQMHGLCTTAAGDILVVGASPLSSGDVILIEIETGAEQKLACSSLGIDAANISVPASLVFPVGDDETAQGFYYPPTNSHYCAEPNALPPLIVMCHGGPTGANYGILNYKIQYWTSRGFALLDVNYRGSTGYGRRYREKINGRWGVVDVEDAAAGASFVVNTGLAAAGKTIIRGSSAGGFTVLAALAFTDSFAAGTSLYGIGDLEALARDTHKFEARYLDTLVGPYPAAKEIYIERSPISHLEKLNCPVIFLQGMEDNVVPPNQASAMVGALKEKGIPVAYITFDDEGHGFRKADNIKRALQAELYFYRKIFAITDKENLPAIRVENLCTQ